MNPDKLFDYLDGKLSPADRTDLEEKLMSDAQLRQQFAVAREIHRTGRDSREVLLPPDAETAERGGRLGRRIATVAFILVLLNVAGGLAVISWKAKRPAQTQRDAAVRRQLEDSLGAAGRNALPTPSLNDDEMNLAAPRGEWDHLATSVIAAADAAGGSAVRDDRADEVILTASIPRARLGDFRRQLLGPNASVSTVTNSSSGQTATVQIRIAESAR